MSFKPRKGQAYWMLNSRFEVKESTNTGSTKSKGRIAAGNAFKTKADAWAFRDYITSKQVLELKNEFDKKIAFAYGFATGAFIAGLICAAVWR